MASQNTISTEPVTRQFSTGSPLGSISTDLAITKSATIQSSGKMGSLVIVLLIVLLGIAVVFIALEVYRLRVQSRCLLQSHNMQVLEQIVSELPKDINESVDRRLKDHENRTFNAMEQQMEQYHQHQIAVHAAHAMVSSIPSVATSNVNMPLPTHLPVDGSYESSAVMDPALVIETLTMPRVNEQPKVRRPSVVIQDVSDEQKGIDESENLPEMQDPSHGTDDECPSETVEMESDFDLDDQRDEDGE